MQNYQDKISSILSARALHRPLDVALIGATGVGKSSTINRLFGSDVAKVGTGADPETQFITHHKVSDVFRLHDTAGLGDGASADQRHAQNLTDLLLDTYTNDETYYLIDLAFVILDGSHRDMGTTYKVLENIVLNCISPDRVIVAINQADMAMKGRYWNANLNCPEPELLRFLQEKSRSVKNRIKEATGLSISEPVFYSAEYKYNLDKVMEHIINHIPNQRRNIK